MPLLRSPRARTLAALLAVAACNASARPSSAGEAAQSADAAIAITHVTLIDGTGAPPREDVTIVVRGRRIESVAASGSQPIPADARVIDGSGRFVIPGLIDAHVHNGTIEERPQRIAEAILRNALLGGVTTVRDMGGRGSNVRALAVRAAADTSTWPRIYTSMIVAGPGMWFEGRRGTYMAEGGPIGEAPLVRRVDSTTDLRAAIAAAKAAGASGIKIYNTVDPRLLPRIVAEAHRAGLRAWSHLAVDPGRPSDLVAAGIDALSHADQFVAEVNPWPAAGTPREVAREARHRAFLSAMTDTMPFSRLLAEMKRRGTALDATLFIMTPRPDSTGRVSEQAATLYRFATSMVRRANAAGVPIVAGTDALGGSSPNIHAELQLLVDSAGLTPMQAIRAATSNAARVLGAEDSIGTVAAGKLADLVILRADPLADIANTLTVASVMKAGRLHERTDAVRVPPLARAPRGGS